MMKSVIAVMVAAGLAIALLVVPATAQAQDQSVTRPGFINIDLQKDGDTGQVSVVMQIFVLLTVLSLAPAILIMLTSFTRITIVLSLLRQALGSNQLPPSQIIIGLSLFLTFFIMAPVWQKVNQQAIQPYLEHRLTTAEAFKAAMEPVRKFMIGQTREKDLALMIEVARMKHPSNVDAVPNHILIPAFVISELKTAFQIGFLLYLPFLIIDMVVASVLLSMGMMMLPPVMVSLPFKLMIFVLADGWYLIVGSLVKGFTG